MIKITYIDAQLKMAVAAEANGNLARAQLHLDLALHADSLIPRPDAE